MNINFLTFVLALAIAASGYAADSFLVEPVKLKESAAIQWEGRSNETIDAQKITQPVSILLWRCSNIVISVCDLRSIELAECQNVTIRNCWIHDSTHCGVEISKSKNVIVQGCRMESVASGVYAVLSQNIQVIGNFVRNVNGPLPRGQLAQFDKVSGPDNIIRSNYAVNDYSLSNPEDLISLYMSNGEVNSPILIEDNFLTADAKRGSSDKSTSGSGIMLGDSSGSYLTCRRNVIVSAGQVGIGVAGGRFVRVEDNLIYGRKSNVSNVGLYIWNQSGQPSDHVVLSRNRVQWLSQTGEENSWWDGGGVQNVEFTGNQLADPTLEAALPSPPTRAPMPPKPWVSPNDNGVAVARLPWKPK